MNGENDTIAAIATAPGLGGISIVRISGPRCLAIASQLTGKQPAPRMAQRAQFKDSEGATLDEGLVLYFKAPNSYTGEDVVELHGHGGMMAPHMMLQAAINLGARLARPGEFTQRAFLKGKLDLTQAEAVADLIESRTARAAKMALRSLQGLFSAEVNSLAGALLAIRVQVEGSLDFPDEDPKLVVNESVLLTLRETQRRLKDLLEQSRKGEALRSAVRVVIIGRPNVGKSSLLNRLSGVDRAIVMDTPGTTRDVIEHSMSLEGLQIEVVDTAGIHDTRDPVESEGVRRALQEIHSADIVLLVSDSETGLIEDRAYFSAWLGDDMNLIQVRNKVDQGGGEASRSENGEAVCVHISALTGAGLPLLSDAIREAAGITAIEENAFLARSRHIEALQEAAGYLDEACGRLQSEGATDLAAEELACAHRSLGRITGEVHSDELLGEIFSRFCIGK
jgi:tRNA modification GTPase